MIPVTRVGTPATMRSEPPTAEPSWASGLRIRYHGEWCIFRPEMADWEPQKSQTRELPEVVTDRL